MRAPSRTLLATCGLACAFLSSCSYRLEYRGEIGRGLLPDDEGDAPYVSIAPIPEASALYVRVPIREDEPGRQGQILSFSLPGGEYRGVFRDDLGRDDRALRIAATATGDLAVLRAPEASRSGALEYELSVYDGGHAPIGRARLRSPFPRDSVDAPYAVGIAVAEDGDAAVAWADPDERELGGVSLYSDLLASASAEPSLTADLESFRGKLPLSAEGKLKVTALCYRDGDYYLAVEMASEPFDGILVLDRELRFVRYVTGEWAFDCPTGVAVDASGLIYATNRWSDNLVAYRGDRLLTKSAKGYMYGAEGSFMNGPGAVVASGDELYAYDSANGRLLRFSTVLPGRSADRARAERILRPIVPRYAADGGFDSWLIPFVLGCFAVLAIHGFVVGATSREREFLFLGLINLCAFLFFIERSYFRFFIDIDGWDVTMGLYIGALILFTRDYISRAGWRGWVRASLGVLGILALASSGWSALSIALNPMEYKNAGIRASDLPSIAAIVLILGILVYESARRNREARIALALNSVLLVSGFLSLGIVDLPAIKGTIFEHVFSQGYLLMLGSLLNSLILSLDLGSHLGSMKAAKTREEVENRSLRELDRQKTDFIMNVSHELRTPLSVILGVTGRGGADDDDERLSGAELAMIRRNAQKLRKDIDNLLALSCLERRSSGMQASSVSLSPFLSLLTAEFSSLAEARGLRLSLTPPDEGLRVRADRALLETALLNLVTNAIKFTPPGGSVTIGARADDQAGFARIEVADTGIGVPPELREKIFRRFFRAEAGNQRKYEGAGIGLALVREIAELHGGRAEAESERGKGSTFALVLPLDPDPSPDGDEATYADDAVIASYKAELQAGPAAATPIAAAARGRAGSVLIAEDNEDLRSTLTAILAERFDVRVAPNGAEALKAIEERAPDCVVSDIMMPVMDGHELFLSLRSNSRGADLPFVFLTARADPEEREQALRDGALDYIEKPFSPPELIAKVENLIALKRSVSAKVKTQLKNSIVELIDSMDERADKASPREGRMDYEELFREKGLSERESEVARLIIGGSSDKEIAYSLGISASTVANHNNKLYRKLGISSRVELISMGTKAPER